MVKTAEFKYGETINYNGQKAVVVESHSYSRYITLEINGQFFTVEKHSLFSMDNMKKYYEYGIDECDRRIARNRDIIEQSKIDYDFGAALVKKCRTGMARILAEFKAKSVDDINDAAKRKEYLSLSDEKAYGKVLKNRASADIMSAAIDTGSVCSTKMNLINQQAVLEYLT